VEDKLVIDNWTKQTPGDFFYGYALSRVWTKVARLKLTRSFSQGTVEEKGIVDMIANKPVEILVEYTNSSPPNDSTGDTSSQPALMRGVVRFFIGHKLFS
jgi:beta-glucosidase